jgi:hemin uptake protein HemP
MIVPPDKRVAGGAAKAAPDGSARADKAARMRSRDLLGDHGELVIEHEGKEYRLRRTRNGKLILTA